MFIKLLNITVVNSTKTIVITILLRLLMFLMLKITPMIVMIIS